MKNFLIVLLMIVIIAGTGYGVYYQIDNHNKKNETDNEVNNEVNSDSSNSEKYEEIDKNSSEINNLLSYFDSFNDDCVNGGKNIGYFYKDLTNDGIKNEIKLVIALEYILKNDQYTFPMSKETMDSVMIKIFGNANYSTEFSKDEYVQLQSLIYNSSDKQFEYLNFPYGCSGPMPYYDRKIQTVKKYSDKIEIELEVAYIEYNTDLTVNIYSDSTKNNLVHDNISLAILPSMDIYNTDNKYIFTYNKDEQGNYYLFSVELVK